MYIFVLEETDILHTVCGTYMLTNPLHIALDLQSQLRTEFLSFSSTILWGDTPAFT